MTGREARLARNEALFRGVNERVKEVKAELTGASGVARVDFICECGRSDCVEQVRLTVAEYEAARAHETRFIVKPGHEVPEVEGIVHEGDDYLVVEKHEGEAAIARETDPRS